MSNYRCVLLDADGTLLDFEQAEEQAFFETCAAHGLPADREVYARYRRINQGYWDKLERGEVTKDELVVRRYQDFLGEMGRGEDPAAFNRAYMGNLAHGHAVIAGARELLEKLRGHCRLVMITNGVAATQYPRLRGSGLLPYFDAVLVSEELGVKKPDAAFFELALEKGGCGDPAEALVVGDSVSADILGANLCGIDACWFNPAHKEMPRGRWARYVVDSLEQVAAVVLEPRGESRLLEQRARFHYIDQNRSCAEAVLYGAADRLGISLSEDARRMIGGFSGGLGGGVCGAAAAGCAALGLALLDEEGAHGSQALRPACEEFTARFERRAGALGCAALKPGNFTEESRCLKLVELAAGELDRVLLRYLSRLPENRA